MKKITKKQIKPFLSGFDYGIKHYSTIEDKHFFTYFGDTSMSSVYRNGIKSARKYMQYRYEILALIVLIFTTLLFMFTW
jgi:hypothetical protein